ncbi:MAG: amidohydrolase [Planctomycetota bacterium]|nr:MAG: amidohydrolase [Planctomycetota bacterium]
MPETFTTQDSVARTSWNRRQVLAAVGTAAGALAVPREASAAPAAGNKCFVRVAAVSYGTPFHDHQTKGVNLTALRDMTAKVAKDRPDFICYPEICTCGAGGFEKGLQIAPELAPYVAEVSKIAREFNTAIIAPFIERQGTRRFNSVPIVDRQGKLVLVYRKNYPTIGELEMGITPGHEVPVADCDGVRVGATVCFDLNFDHVAVELERQKAQLIFWPSMYWGGALLQHWAMRYGFVMAAAYGAESCIVDMNGRYLAKIGNDTLKVRQGYLPPWAIADINVNRELFHLDDNQKHFVAMREKYGPDLDIEVEEPEGYFLLASRRPDLTVETIAAEFHLETLRDYLARSVKLRNERLKR